MADFTKRSVADMAAANPGMDLGTSGSLHEIDWGTGPWGAVESGLRERHPSRPYARPDRTYDHYQPAYRYGASAAHRHTGREWNEVEPDLEREWSASRGESGSTWQDVKDAIRDAWEDVRGRK